ncbi:MAG: alpha/beta hydrolase [Candidatus Paceibacterota bacterium]|jgi:pimeloyl-ACP methyl ester carboxylesterase
MKFKKNIIRINDRNVFYLDSDNQKPAIILLHGFPGNHMGLIKIANYIGENNYRLIIPDLPACGSSDSLNKKHNLKNYSDWLNDFLKALSIDEVIIIGHSFGSRIALVFTNHYPKRVKRLVLITPVLKVDGLLNRILSIYYGITGLLPKYLQKIMLSNGFGKKMGNRIIFKSSDPKIHKEIIDRDIEEIKKLKPQVSIEIFDEFYKFSLIPVGKEIKKDSLLIAGEIDRVSPLGPIRELFRQLPNVKLEIMKNCGHLLPLEKPEATAKIIKKWL